METIPETDGGVRKVTVPFSNPDDWGGEPQFNNQQTFPPVGPLHAPIGRPPQYTAHPPSMEEMLASMEHEEDLDHRPLTAREAGKAPANRPTLPRPAPLSMRRQRQQFKKDKKVARAVSRC